MNAKELYVWGCKGNPEAIACLEALFDVLHFWDDLIDGDQPVDAAYINSSMWMALVTLPENKFWQVNFYALQPILKQAIFNWHAANRMELEDDELGKHVAFILRSTYVDLATACAQIIGGPAWAGEVAYVVRKETSKEGFDGFLAALQNEKRKD